MSSLSTFALGPIEPSKSVTEAFFIQPASVALPILGTHQSHHWKIHFFFEPAGTDPLPNDPPTSTVIGSSVPLNTGLFTLSHPHLMKAIHPQFDNPHCTSRLQNPPMRSFDFLAMHRRSLLVPPNSISPSTPC